MALDGRGSSTMVIEGVDGPGVLNAAIEDGVPGKERAVGYHQVIAPKK